MRVGQQPREIGALRQIGQIRTTLGPFKERHVPLCWRVGPSSQPADLGPRLEAQGLVHAEEGPGMAVDLDALDAGAVTAAGLAIVAVDDGATLRAWIDALCVSALGPTSPTRCARCSTASWSVTGSPRRMA